MSVWISLLVTAFLLQLERVRQDVLDTDFGGSLLEPEIALDERRHEYHTVGFAALAYLLRHFFRRMRGETTNHFGYVSRNDGSCATLR